MKKLLLTVFAAVSLCLSAQDNLTNVFWDLIGDSTSTAAQDELIATMNGEPLSKDGVTLCMVHPKDGYGSQLKTGIYFHETTAKKGDNYIRMTVPKGQKGIFRFVFRPRNNTSDYTFYAMTLDKSATMPAGLYQYNDAQHQIAFIPALPDYSPCVVEKRYDFSTKTEDQAIVLWFPATGLRYRGFGWEQLPDTTVIGQDTIPEQPIDTTVVAPTDSLPLPLPTYNADFSKTIRILGIGNSFTVDLLDQHFVPLCQGEGLNVIVGYPYQGGTTLAEHVSYYNNGSKVYDYRKWTNGVLRKTGENTATLKQALQDEPWDLVLVQSRGSVTSYYDASASMSELIAVINKEVTNEHKMAHYMTWSDAKCGSLISNNQDAATDSMCFWAARNFNRFGYDYIIPVGRAIQNARTSFIGDNLNRDCHHLSMSEGRYIAALVFYEILTGKSCIGVNYYPASMTAYRALVCQEASHAAVLDPLHTTDLSKTYGVEKGIDPFKYMTIDGVRYSNLTKPVYMDVEHTETVVAITTNDADTTIVVTTPEKGKSIKVEFSLVAPDGDTVRHAFTATGAEFKRHLWDAVSTTDEISPTQDSICKAMVLPRGEYTLQAFDKGGNPGTGAKTGFYLHVPTQANPKSYICLSVPANKEGLLNVTARLGTALKNAVPPYPFYAYAQDASLDEPTTLYTTVTIGDAEVLANYASLDNYDPLVMDGLYYDFMEKDAQHIYIYNMNDSQRYRQIEWIELNTEEEVPIDALNDVTASAAEVVKFIRDGQVFILKDGKTYNVLGVEMK